MTHAEKQLFRQDFFVLIKDHILDIFNRRAHRNLTQLTCGQHCILETRIYCRGRKQLIQKPWKKSSAAQSYSLRFFLSLNQCLSKLLNINSPCSGKPRKEINWFQAQDGSYRTCLQILASTVGDFRWKMPSVQCNSPEAWRSVPSKILTQTASKVSSFLFSRPLSVLPLIQLILNQNQKSRHFVCQLEQLLILLLTATLPYWKKDEIKTATEQSNVLAPWPPHCSNNTNMLHFPKQLFNPICPFLL